MLRLHATLAHGCVTSVASGCERRAVASHLARTSRLGTTGATGDRPMLECKTRPRSHDPGATTPEPPDPGATMLECKTRPRSHATPEPRPRSHDPGATRPRSHDPGATTPEPRPRSHDPGATTPEPRDPGATTPEPRPDPGATERTMTLAAIKKSNHRLARLKEPFSPHRFRIDTVFRASDQKGDHSLAQAKKLFRCVSSREPLRPLTSSAESGPGLVKAGYLAL